MTKTKINKPQFLQDNSKDLPNDLAICKMRGSFINPIDDDVLRRRAKERESYYKYHDKKLLKAKRYREKNKEKMKEYQKKYLQLPEVKKRRCELAKKYRDKLGAKQIYANYKKKYLSIPEIRERKLEYASKYNRITCDELRKQYVTKLLVKGNPNLNSKDIPQELIEIMRLQLQLKREVRNVSQNI